MTLRYRIRSTALACALGCGAALAVPAMIGVAAAQQPVIRDDPMAVVATQAYAHLEAYIASGSLGQRIAYHRDRRTLAETLGARLDISPDELEDAWRVVDVPHQEALLVAFTQLGVPYRHFAQSPGEGFDCSGLTGYAWSRAGVSLSHQSEAQIRESSSRTRDTAHAGDLVQYPGHVMIWLGVGDAIVHSPYTGRTVEVDMLTARRAASVSFADPTG